MVSKSNIVLAMSLSFKKATLTGGFEDFYKYLTSQQTCGVIAKARLSQKTMNLRELYEHDQSDKIYTGSPDEPQKLRGTGRAFKNDIEGYVSMACDVPEEPKAFGPPPLLTPGLLRELYTKDVLRKMRLAITTKGFPYGSSS